MPKRSIKVCLRLAFAVLVLLSVFLLVERIRGQVSLARYKATLERSGELLTAQQVMTQRTKSNARPREVFAAIERLPNGNVVLNHYPPQMRATASGRAVVGFREDFWTEDKTNYTWAQLSSELKGHEATLKEIQLALLTPVFQSDLDLAEGSKLKFPHLAPAKSLSRWYGVQAQLALHEGRPGEAVEALVAQLQAPKLLAEDRVLISELVRFAMAGIALSTTWEAMQAEGWTDQDLLRLQTTWARLEFLPGFTRALEGERAFILTSAVAARGSNQAAYDYVRSDEGGPLFPSEPDGEISWGWISPHGAIYEFFRKRIYCPIWRFAWSHQDERRLLGEIQLLLTSVRVMSAARSFVEREELLSNLKRVVTEHGFYNRLRYPQPGLIMSLAHSVQRVARTETDRSFALCAIALKRYAQRHGTLPGALADLVPEFLETVPVDYFDGKAMKYHLNASGNFTLYSVGQDGKDDGGDLSLMPEVTLARNNWLRRDYVWPLPASPEEVVAYRAEAGKY